MGSVIEVCKGMCDEQNHEFFLNSNLSPNNSSIKANKKLEINSKRIQSFVPYNMSNEIIINTNNETNKINIGNENDLLLSINKLSLMIESLEYKNKILEKEKNEIKEEKGKLEKELEIFKNKSKIKRINSIKNSDNLDSKSNSYNIGDKIKLIFIFKNGKNNKNKIIEPNEELYGYKNELFIEIKLRLLNKRNLGKNHIIICYYNSKEINDWLTLEELNLEDNSNIICEIT